MVGIPEWNDEEHKPTTNNKQVNASMRDQRIEICENCKYMSAFKTCRKCGCFLPLKTYFYFFDCPLGKWPEVE